MNALHRVRAFAGQFALLAILALVAALLLTAVPRTANRLADDGLRQYVAAQPPALRDITLVQSEPQFGDRSTPPDLPRQLTDWQAAMAPALRDVVGERWYAGQAAQARIGGPGAPATPQISLSLTAMSGAQPAVTMVEGRWPGGNTLAGAPLEVVLDEQVAHDLGLRTGARLSLAPENAGAGGAPHALPLPPVQAELVGLFRPVDPTGGIWDVLPSPLRVAPPPADGLPFVAGALTTETNLLRRQLDGWPVAYSWRYRMAPQRLDASRVGPVIEAVRRLTPPDQPRMSIVRGVDIPLSAYLRSLETARAVLTIVSAGALATLVGLVILAARLAVRRRAEELALIRARGGSLRGLAGRALAESSLVIPLAAAVGWAAGIAVPGRPAGTTWLVVLVAAVTTLALPVAAVVGLPATGARRDLLRLSPSARRLTLEATVLAVAVLGTFLLRRRGLPPGGTVDPLLACVPVLLAIGVSVLALRGYGWPLWLFSRLAARARGSVAFLGLARAGRSAVTGPLVVVVLAVATAAFCGVVATGISDGRDRAAGLAVPADAMITGDRFAPDTAARLAELPGVRSVAPLLAQPNEQLYPSATGATRTTQPVNVLLVDGAAFARVVADSGVKVDLPAALIRATAGTGPVPAVVSPRVAADLTGPAGGATGPAGGRATGPAAASPRAGTASPGRTAVAVRGQRVEFTVAAVTDTFPAIPRDIERFVVLPWQALPAQAGAPLIPTGFLVAATAVDEAALKRTGDDGQRRYATTGLVTGSVPARPSAVTNFAKVRGALGRNGANSLLVFGFVAGTAGGAGLGLLAIAFAVLAGARARGRVLSRLRTMGLSGPQWRGLLIVELTPLVGVAMLTGALVGAVMPLLLTPALGLSAFTEDVPVRVRFEPALVGGVFALGVLALGVALAVEAIVNRRLRLGEVLRLGEES